MKEKEETKITEKLHFLSVTREYHAIYPEYYAIYPKYWFYLSLLYTHLKEKRERSLFLSLSSSLGAFGTVQVWKLKIEKWLSTNDIKNLLFLFF